MKKIIRVIRKMWLLSTETVARIVATALSIIGMYEQDNTPVKISLSRGNRKIGKAYNFSTMPVVTCGNCHDCARGCYAMKSAARYPTCIRAWSKNTFMVRHFLQDVYQQLTEEFRRVTKPENKYCRIHVAGEFEVTDYAKQAIVDKTTRKFGWATQPIEFARWGELAMWVQLATEHPDWTFWTYTKMHWVVNLYCLLHGGRHAVPSNLTIMFSRWGLRSKIDNPYGFPEFITVLTDEGETMPEGFWVCPGRCKECKKETSKDGKCHGCLANETTVTENHN